MEIKINALRLRNFKGVRNAEYLFGGRNACIEGPNGSGKSTVFDAFTWLLFGKDHRDQTASSFELKTIDPATGRPVPRLDHWVEAILTVDGTDHVLRRAWIENWVKPTGAIDDVLKGHTSAFFVDGVDVGTKAAYDAVVGGWLKEDSFKLLTNPHYFIDDAFTAWKDRRRALLDLVKDDPGRVRVREEFADVVNKLSGRSIEEYRKRLAAEKAANKRDLANTLSRIAGMKEALPEDADAAGIETRLATLRTKRDEAVAALRAEADSIDQAIASADKADEARKAENDAVFNEITRIQYELGRILTEAKSAALAQNNARDVDIIRVRANLSSYQAKMRASKAQEERTRSEIAPMEAERTRMGNELAALGVEYNAAKAKAFEFKATTICPYCGQQIPAATLEEAREKEYQAFIDMKKAEVQAILEKARALKEKIGEQDARLKGMKDILFKVAKEYDLADTNAAKWSGELKRLEAQPARDLNAAVAEARESDEYKALKAQEQELQTRAILFSTRPEGVDELVNRRKDVEQRIHEEMDRFAGAEVEAQQALSVGKVRADQLALIRQKEQEAQHFADAIAQQEREEARAAEFVKADIDSVEAAINGIFSTARWKMFDRTIDGGIVEMCEVTSPDGVPYRSMNDAMKIECGMDCIRVFSTRFGSTAPIFIDNAESIIRDTFNTPAQVIRLVVKDTPELTLITE